MRVYIAGPYTGGDPVLNTRRAVEAAEAVIATGHTPFVPHLTHLWHLISPHAVEFWYDYDLEWLAVCDCIMRLPGESPGADAEVKEGRARGLAIYTLEEFLARR